jgi:hypothetical protein
MAESAPVTHYVGSRKGAKPKPKPKPAAKPKPPKKPKQGYGY